jgi:hypothetical protein
MPRTTRRQPHPAAAPQPSAEADPETAMPPGPTPAPREGRDARGRFARGNQGGPGNPFARQVAALRKQLVESVTPEVMANICQVLLLRAQGGNLAAVKLLFSYVLGRPPEAVNPDTLDHEEMELYGREVGMDDLLGKVLASVPAELACECVRQARPDILDKVCAAAVQQGLDALSPADPSLEVPGAGCGQAAPSANGFNGGPAGEAPPAGDAGEAPLANGDNREAEDADESAVATDDGKEAPTANGTNRRAPAARPGHSGTDGQRPVRTGRQVSAEVRQGSSARKGEGEALPPEGCGPAAAETLDGPGRGAVTSDSSQ